jgi:hypothetical protein
MAGRQGLEPRYADPESVRARRIKADQQLNLGRQNAAKVGKIRKTDARRRSVDPTNTDKPDKPDKHKMERHSSEIGESSKYGHDLENWALFEPFSLAGVYSKGPRR